MGIQDALKGGGDTAFGYRMLVFALVIMFIIPVGISVLGAGDGDGATEQEKAIDESYRDFTGNYPTQESVWALTGIYTPYGGGSYGHTDDGWLYGSKVGVDSAYTPSQVSNSGMSYSVRYDEDTGTYVYTDFASTLEEKKDDDPAGTVYTAKYGGWKTGDTYSQVMMDAGQKSKVMFTANGKTTAEGGFFYYDYSGYRYAFQPLSDYYTSVKDASGEQQVQKVTSNTTSLSLIWYDYYDGATINGQSVGGSGVSGQLILTGSDTGVAYITADQIVKSFDTLTSTSKFLMNFNGVDMNIYIRLSPYYLSQGYSVTECYNAGYWEIMVSSLSVETESTTGTDSSFNVSNVFKTMIDLLTFNADEIGITGTMGTVASVLISFPLYAALIVIGLNNYPVLILVGILAALQSISHLGGIFR